MRPNLTTQKESPDLAKKALVQLQHVITECAAACDAAFAHTTHTEALPALQYAAGAVATLRDALGEHGAPWPLVSSAITATELFHRENEKFEAKQKLISDINRLLAEWTGSPQRRS